MHGFSCEASGKLRSFGSPVLELDNGVIMRPTWKRFSTVSYSRGQVKWLILSIKGQVDGVTGCPDIWLNIMSGCVSKGVSRCNEHLN